jgi:hypothetical protein
MPEKKSKRMTLIASDDKKPAVSVKAGQELHVTTIAIQGPNTAKLKKVSARLCGGTSTCLALMDVGPLETG